MIAWRRPTVYVGVIAVIVAAWAVLTISRAVKPLLLASIPDVGVALGQLFQQPAGVVGPIGLTLAEAGIALGLAVIAGVGLGLVIGASPLLRRAYEPLATGLAALPLVILYPVLAASLGVGPSSKIVLGALYAFFPLLIATMRAVGRVDEGLIASARAMGASRREIVLSVMMPAVSLPVIAASRVAWALALVTIIAAEFIAGANGVGYELAQASHLLNTPVLFAWVLLTVALTVLANLLFTLLTRLLLKGIER